MKVLVTGATRRDGIGAATVLKFLSLGHEVTLTHRNALDWSPPPEVRAIRCDVTDLDQVDQLCQTLDDHGGCDVFVSNAGFARLNLTMRAKDDWFDSHINTNLKGPFAITRRVLPGMSRRRFGRIVYVSSIAAFYGPAGQAGYAAAKAGLTGLARTVTRELAVRNVTANVVAPGLTKTAVATGALGRALTDLEVQVPARRWAEPADIAHAIAFLASPESGYISGVVLPVDGGLTMGH
jgi:3-oxoacyl-[acyl-carrier protein] reductase